ncbi:MULTISPECIES: RND transporter [unclassified Nocardioides]|uniref:RND transporter n=1 Tax=unclassified Nocardioides TaxID=2615069 RepID=UPI0009E7617A|nr:MULTISPECIES: RND transporter [unclassified Nocardioides]
MTPLRRLLGLVLIAMAIAMVGIGLSQVRTDTTSASFLSLDDPSQKASLEAARSFGGDPIVVVAESKKSGGLLGREQITALVGLEGELSRLPDVAVVYGPGTVLNQVAGQAQNMLATISGRRDGLRADAEQRARAAGASKAEATKAADAAVAKFDVRYGSLLAKGLPAGLPTLRNPGFVRAVVFDEEGEPRQQWRFVVPRPNAIAIVVRPREGLDQAATERLVERTKKAVGDAGLQTTKVTVTGMPVIASGLGGMLRHEIPLLGSVALVLIGACYAFLPWLSRRRARLLPLVATLGATAITLALFGWLDHPLSLGVVAFLPIIMGTGSDFPAYLLRGADRRRVIVTAVAAAAGFLSLAISPVPFVRDLGIALATGVLIAVALGLLISKLAPRSAELPDVPEATLEPAAVPVRGRALSPLARFGVLMGAGAIGLVGWLALPHLDIAAQPEQLAQGVPELDDATYAEGVLGSAGEVQVFVRGDDVLTPANLAWMNRAQEITLRRFGDRLHPVASPPSLLAFLGENPTVSQIQAGLDQMPHYLRSSVIRDDRRQAVLSFGIELDDVGEQQQLLRDLREALPPPPDGTTVDLAGLPVVTGRSYELVSQDRYLASLAGIGAAGLVLLIGLRRRADALRAVGAASLATGWGLAGAWFLGVSLTPLTVTLGCLATATACEFSVLLGAGRVGPRSVVVRRAVLVAAAAAASGYLALIVSGLAVIRDFGLFLAATVGLSLLAAQVMRLTTSPTPVAAPAVNQTEPTRMKVKL